MSGGIWGWCAGYLSKKGKVKAAHLVRDDDVAPGWRSSSDTPIATQIDGDYLGLREETMFRSVPDALDVVAVVAPRRNLRDLR